MLYVAIGIATAALLMACLQTEPNSGIWCDPTFKEPGSVINNDMRCKRTKKNEWECYLPQANCASFGATVRKVDPKDTHLIAKLVSGKPFSSFSQGTTDDGTFLALAMSEGAVVTDGKGCFVVEGCIANERSPCTDLTVETTTEAWKELPWPVVRYAIGSILGGG